MKNILERQQEHIDILDEMVDKHHESIYKIDDMLDVIIIKNGKGN